MSSAHPSCLPLELLELYEVHNFRHAAEVLHSGCRPELDELVQALLAFRLTTADILKKGGNESDIPKRLGALLRPAGWYETRISGDLIVTLEERGTGGEGKGVRRQERTIESFLDGHKIDFVKNRVAF